MPLTLSLMKAKILSELCSSNFLISVVEQIANFIRHKVLFVPYLLHNLNKPEYLPFQGMENHRGFLQNSSPMPNNPTHRQQSSSFLLCTASRFASRVQVLSFHSIAYQIFFSFIQTKIYNSMENFPTMKSEGFTWSEALAKSN